MSTFLIIFFACRRFSHSTQVCIKKYETINRTLTLSLRDQLISVFADLEGITNLCGIPIGSLAYCSSTSPPPFTGNGNFSQDGSGDQGGYNDRYWRSHSCDRDEFEDSASPPILPRRH